MTHIKHDIADSVTPENLVKETNVSYHIGKATGADGNFQFAKTQEYMDAAEGLVSKGFEKQGITEPNAKMADAMKGLTPHEQALAVVLTDEFLKGRELIGKALPVDFVNELENMKQHSTPKAQEEVKNRERGGLR